MRTQMEMVATSVDVDVYKVGKVLENVRHHTKLVTKHKAIGTS